MLDTVEIADVDVSEIVLTGMVVVFVDRVVVPIVLVIVVASAAGLPNIVPVANIKTTVKTKNFFPVISIDFVKKSPIYMDILPNLEHWIKVSDRKRLINEIAINFLLFSILFYDQKYLKNKILPDLDR